MSLLKQRLSSVPILVSYMYFSLQPEKTGAYVAAATVYMPSEPLLGAN